MTDMVTTVVGVVIIIVAGWFAVVSEAQPERQWRHLPSVIGELINDGR